jgi:hypothetical protein
MAQWRNGATRSGTRTVHVTGGQLTGFLGLHAAQPADLLAAVDEGRPPAVTGEAAVLTTELAGR